MVIDKNGILKILRSSKEEVSEHKEKGEDSILITTECDDFNKDGQIGNDSIDLRISNRGYILNGDYEYINTLSDENFSKYFEEVHLNSEQGYDLKPGDILFIGTVEQIHLEGDLIGRVTGRSVFSRFGLSVHCTQDKFSSGINSIAALQIKNNSNVVLKIFPYQKLAQLMIEKTSPNQIPYKGTFSLEEEYKLPSIKPSDREQYPDRTQAEILKLKPKKQNIFQKRSKNEKFYSALQSIISLIITIGIAIVGFINAGTAIKITFAVILFVVQVACIGIFYLVADGKGDLGEKKNF